ncbi:hypothetical protein CYMTET_42810 [Cymbomonas tetramitiformis]|uniref:Uncharacterized protein n=1 Tax=Cymbomonas tetramitiformis TaxID=36881 RepID=A0AAE0F0N1_9CHLO|nr:hypothetical protein CYMTET_42810 [Cymbomonas tetramitiformis]
MKRKLETGPEEWETKKQRITRLEEERAKRDNEPTERGAEEEDMNTTGREDEGAQQILAEWDMLLWEAEEAELNTIEGNDAVPEGVDGEEHRETRSQKGPNQTGQRRWRTPQGAEGTQENG